MKGDTVKIKKTHWTAGWLFFFSFSTMTPSRTTSSEACESSLAKSEKVKNEVVPVPVVLEVRTCFREVCRMRAI